LTETQVRFVNADGEVVFASPRFALKTLQAVLGHVQSKCELMTPEGQKLVSDEQWLEFLLTAPNQHIITVWKTSSKVICSHLVSGEMLDLTTVRSFAKISDALRARYALADLQLISPGPNLTAIPDEDAWLRFLDM
jgi:hypothetical protein